MQIVSAEALLSINETLIVQLISFLIFLFIINRVMFRPLRGLMKEREQHVDKIKSDISEAEIEYERLLDQIKKRESAVRREALLMQDKLEKSGGDEAMAIMESTRKEISDLKKKVAKELQSQISEAKQQVKEETEGIAVAIMGKVLDRSPQL
ncbi:MAG: ATP synthase F0 subunit B [Deltaproteobacteria bacterium]|nr:ATP synthase F0 subunit B [Deltaproteobacteria bacterium]